MITQEERNNLRQVVEYSKSGVVKVIPLPWQTVEMLLNALEVAEASVSDVETSLVRAQNTISEQCAGIDKISAANHALAAKAKKAEAENARLRERLEAALDKIAEIQENDNWEKADGVCYACGICSGIPDEWQPTDDHCCREILDLWSSGEPLPWEAARRAKNSPHRVHKKSKIRH